MMFVVNPVTITAGMVLSSNTTGDDANYWYDALINTQTSETGPIELSIYPGAAFDTVVLLNLNAQSVDIEVLDGVGGAQVFAASYSTDNAYIDNWYDYFNAPFNYAAELVVTGLPTYANGVVNITINENSTADVGFVAIGTAVQLGDVGHGIRLGIRDYSTKDVDGSGNVTLTEGEYAKRLDGEIRVDSASLNYVQKQFSDLRATAAVWVPGTASNYSCLTTYGYPRDWQATVNDAQQSLISFSIEGMI